MRTLLSSVLTTFLTTFLATALLSSQALALPGASPGDPRVRHALDAAKLNYTVTDAGDFRLLMNFQGGRSQVVLVSSQTYTLEGVEIREVWSVVNDYGAGEIPAADANYLLARNTSFKLGAFATRHFGATMGAIFLAKVAAASTASALETAIWAAAQTADDAEEALTKQDRF